MKPAALRFNYMRVYLADYAQSGAYDADIARLAADAKAADGFIEILPKPGSDKEALIAFENAESANAFLLNHKEERLYSVAELRRCRLSRETAADLAGKGK